MDQTVKSKISGIIRISERCYGCRTCELACSFHHSGLFSPEQSSIRVMKNNHTGVIKWRMDESCDLCGGEDLIFCVHYCSYGALRVGGKP